MGVSPAYLMACRKAGMQLPELPELRVLATAGSPLPAEGYDYVYEQLGPDVLLINGSGGTDVCSAIVSGVPDAPRLPRARSPAAAWASTPPPSTPTAARSSASSASS